jgi:DNA modification methylase
MKVKRHVELADSATRVHEALGAPSGNGRDRVLLRLIRRYQDKRKPISVNFRRILPDLKAGDRLTHLIHPYPAKLLAHIPYFFLSNDVLSKPGDLVLDPFCGSGTVLLEAQVWGRNAMGVDANPLARLIAQVKTTVLDAASLNRCLDSILERIGSKPTDHSPDVVNLKHWFYPDVVRQLQCLLKAVDCVRHAQTRDFFRVCFSVCVRKVSLADPRLSVPVRLNAGRYPKQHPLRGKSERHLRGLRRVRVRDIFEQVARTNIARMEKLRAASLSCTSEVVCSDARKLKFEFSLNGKRDKRIPCESVQLIITSPPYPGAQKYIRACSLSLGWLGLCPATDLREYKSRTIGREEFTKAECDQITQTNVAEADEALAWIRRRSPIRAAIAATYLNEMRLAIQEMYRVLRPGGHIVLVAANNRIAGRNFQTVKYLETIAKQCGLGVEACLIDAIKSRGLMTKRNGTASIITREWVLLFKKGGLMWQTN